MLIHLLPSAIEPIVQAEPSAKHLARCLDNLLRAHREGKHIVFIERDLAKKLTGSKLISEEGRGIVNRVAFKNPEIDGLRRSVAWYLELGHDSAFFGQVEQRGGQQVIRADIGHFEDSGRSQRAILLAENLTDVDLYVLLGRALESKRKWNVRIELEPRGGGGSTIGPTFSRAADDGRIVLAIADGDTRYPEGEIGLTAKALQKAAKGKPGFQRVVVLAVRYAENLIPLPIYEEALGPHPASPSTPERLALLEARVTRPWREHADLKDGLTLFRIRENMKPDSEEHRFWSEVGKDAGLAACTQPKLCTKAAECRCIVVHGLGSRALEKVVEWMEKAGSQQFAHIVKLLDFDKNQRLLKLGEDVLAWGCAYPRTAA